MVSTEAGRGLWHQNQGIGKSEEKSHRRTHCSKKDNQVALCSSSAMSEKMSMTFLLLRKVMIRSTFQFHCSVCWLPPVKAHIILLTQFYFRPMYIPACIGILQNSWEMVNPHIFCLSTVVNPHGFRTFNQIFSLSAFMCWWSKPDFAQHQLKMSGQPISFSYLNFIFSRNASL